jgi:hypothetical protein
MSLNQLELITLFASPKTCTYDKIIAMTSLKYILHHTYQHVILIAFYVHLAQKNRHPTIVDSIFSMKNYQVLPR